MPAFLTTDQNLSKSTKCCWNKLECTATLSTKDAALSRIGLSTCCNALQNVCPLDFIPKVVRIYSQSLSSQMLISTDPARLFLSPNTLGKNRKWRCILHFQSSILYPGYPELEKHLKPCIDSNIGNLSLIEHHVCHKDLSVHRPWTSHIIIIIMQLVWCWTLPFLWARSKLDDFALNDRRLTDQCWVVLNRIQRSGARCDAVGPIGGSSPLATEPHRP